ncbi:MAG: transglycosylase SLT domain-containing protein [Myxococcota bacterium]
MRPFVCLVALLLGIAQAKPHKPKYSNAPLHDARMAFMQGNPNLTITLLQNWFDGPRPPWGRDYDSAHLLKARAHERMGDINLASYHYTRVHRTGRSASEYAGFLEAKMDFKRGRYGVAITECKPFLEQNSNAYYDDCLLITGESQAKLGQVYTAQSTFEQYLKGDQKNPRAEEIELILSEARFKRSEKEGVPYLKSLWLNHRYPTTDSRVTTHLDGINQSPKVESELELRLRIASLSRTARFEEGWSLYKQYAAEHPEDINEDWLKLHHANITWSLRQYIPYAETRMAEYDEQPNGVLAWKIYSAFAKAGAWNEAVVWAREGVEKYRGTGNWYRAYDELARAEMFTNNYLSAAEQWSKLRGNTADFYVAFCYYMAGEYSKAVQAFDENLPRSKEWYIATRYWRAKSLHKLGQTEAAKADETIVLQQDEQGWYRLLLTQKNISPENTSTHRGTWTDSRVVAPPQVYAQHSSTLAPKEWTYHQRDLSFGKRQSFDWTYSSEPQALNPILSDKMYVAHPFIGQLPDPYTTLLWGTDSELSTLFRTFADKHKDTFPVLETIYVLRMGGHYPEAARFLNAFYEDWKTAEAGHLTSKRNAQFRQLGLTANDWRAFFVFVRGHHYGYRFHTKLESEEVDNQIEIDQLEYPIVRASEVWGHGHDFNVDPYLMHGLLRSESAYQEFVVSWAGAIGYVQVMPQTGAKVAYLLNETRYSANDLYEPQTNLRFGMFYFSKLMERFGNSFPIAVGSYNGGPHNMSRWLRPLKDRATLDEYVEHIVYNETRIYVKKVVGNYAEYVRRYEGGNAKVILPSLPEIDDPSVINF